MKPRLFTFLVVATVAFFLYGCSTPQIKNVAAKSPPRDKEPIVQDEFIFSRNYFKTCHASSIITTNKGLLAAWFAGPAEGDPKVGIWIARNDGYTWDQPHNVAVGDFVPGTLLPCWNPVLFRTDTGEILLIYKIGVNPRNWWTMIRTSMDDGHTWSAPRALPHDRYASVRNHPVQLQDGSILCGASIEDQNWRVHMERSTDIGKGWQRSDAINEGKKEGLIQPAILKWPNGKIEILCRSRNGKIYKSWMLDKWNRWTAPMPTELPNPNSGIDALVLSDGRALLVYNHSFNADAPPNIGRSPLNVALSSDGEHWQAALTLESEPGEFSYPSVTQTSDGMVHITYTWKRETIRHVVIDPKKLRSHEIIDGIWRD